LARLIAAGSVLAHRLTRGAGAGQPAPGAAGGSVLYRSEARRAPEQERRVQERRL